MVNTLNNCLEKIHQNYMDFIQTFYLLQVMVNTLINCLEKNPSKLHGFYPNILFYFEHTFQVQS